MKVVRTGILLCVFISCTPAVFAQEYNPLPFVHKEPVFDIAPQFPGGSNAMLVYFADSIRYPEPEKSKRIQGSVAVKFDISKKGKISNVRATNGVPGGPNLVPEAIRVLEGMPNWTPATKKGKPVKVEEYSLHVPFKIKR
jgi:TonB family protein